MSHPHVQQQDRDAIEDRGLIENDHTEMLTAPVNPVAPTTGGSRHTPFATVNRNT